MLTFFMHQTLLCIYLVITQLLFKQYTILITQKVLFDNFFHILLDLVAFKLSTTPQMWHIRELTIADFPIYLESYWIAGTINFLPSDKYSLHDFIVSVVLLSSYLIQWLSMMLGRSGNQHKVEKFLPSLF